MLLIIFRKILIEKTTADCSVKQSVFRLTSRLTFLAVRTPVLRKIIVGIKKEKASIIVRLSMLHNSVGVTGIEPATSRPPDAHSNRTELHPELRVQKYNFFFTLQIFC